MSYPTLIIERDHRLCCDLFSIFNYVNNLFKSESFGVLNEALDTNVIMAGSTESFTLTKRSFRTF